MQFYSPEHFIYLSLLAAVWGIFSWSHWLWKQKMKRIASRELLDKKLLLVHDKSYRGKQLACLMLVLIFSVLALTRPQWGEEKRKIERKGIDVIFLLDTSLSMLAEDLKPNRLEKAKLEMRSFLRQLKGDRVGMVAFAGSSFLQSPLTLDYAAFQLFVDAVSPGYIPDPGTSLAAALRVALKAFPAENLKHKAVVIFSDGEDHEGGMEEILTEVKKSNVRIYTLGTGSEKGDPIPLKNEAGQRSGFKKDRAGQIVLTRLQPSILQKIAEESGGLYAPATPGEQEVSAFIKHMESIDKRQIQEKTVREREDHYQLFLFLAFLFLLLEMVLRQTLKNRTPSAKTQAALALMFLILHSGFLDTPRSLNNKAETQYQEKKYQSAAENYRQAEVKNPKDPVIRYNLGTTLYQTKDYVQAARELEASMANTKDPAVLAPALYNYGNVQYRLGNFEKAVDSYKKALELNPKDQDAKYNLELIENKKKAMDKKDQEKKKQDKQNKPQQNPQQNQQQNQQQQQQQNQEQQSSQSQPQNQNPQNSGSDQQDKPQGSESQENKPQEGEAQPQKSKPQPETQPEDEKSSQGQEEPKPDEAEDPGNQGSGSGEQNQEQKKSGSEAENAPEQPQEENDQAQPLEAQDSGGEKPQGADSAASGSGAQPLQGQMSLNEALRILEAMKDSEKDLQDLRKPPIKGRPRMVEKDW